MNSLVLAQEFNPTLINLGFYPSKIKNDLIAIADLKTNRELHFRTEIKQFRSYKPEDFPDKIPNEISKAIEGNDSWFEEFEVVKPERSVDPFLFGLKDGKRYFICAWDTDEWEAI
jgi:hypothetical protein